MRGVTKVFTIFGIDIQLHYSWWFILIFLSWALSKNFFPDFFPGYTSGTYWLMGISAALLLFISVLLHELSHSLVAKVQKIKVESITLFFFGGVAGITKEDIKPRSEFLMAIAGPLFSLFLGGVFYLINRSQINGIITAITFYLYQLNFILAIFNMVPGYPLDGGRAFRAILYWHYKDLKKATKIAAGVGKFFAGFLIILGIFGLINGIGNGLWFILLGGFLYFIAGVSYNQVVLKDLLDKVPIKDLISKKVPTVKPEMKLKVFMKKYANTDEDVFLVKGKNFSGLLDLKRLGSVPDKMQDIVKLQQVALPLDKVKGINKGENAYSAFKKFSTQNLDLLPVLDKGKVIGIVRRSTLMNRLQWKLSSNK